jgi:hypothetical protein
VDAKIRAQTRLSLNLLFKDAGFIVQLLYVARSQQHSIISQNNKGIMMDFKKFEDTLQLWGNLHFTGIELQQRDNKSEIYATGTNNHTQSQLYICTLSTDVASHVQLKQFRTWLHRINIGKAKRRLALARKD